MPSHSFLGRVTKYVERPRLDARENRLTEVTAGVLEHVDDFAQELVESMLMVACQDLEIALRGADGDARRLVERNLGKSDSWLRLVRAGAAPRVAIQTQLGTSSGRFVDLEIRLRPPTLRPEEDIVLWVEVKHGAPLHGNQLEVYERDAPDNAMVVVVAPLQAMPDVPLHMPLIPWQRIADVVRGAAQRAPAGTARRFTLDAYADYLKEENLMDEAFTPTHALAVAHAGDAHRLLSRLLEFADPEVERSWAKRQHQHTSYGKVKYEPGWWVTYPLQAAGASEPSPRWRETWLEWGLQTDWGRGDDARKTRAYVAGASMGFDNPVAVADNIGWVNDLHAAGFAVYKGDYLRVWSYLYPEQLLAETTLEGQAGLLRDWVLQTFAKLAATPPPH